MRGRTQDMPKSVSLARAAQRPSSTAMPLGCSSPCTTGGERPCKYSSAWAKPWATWKRCRSVTPCSSGFDTNASSRGPCTNSITMPISQATGSTTTPWNVARLGWLSWRNARKSAKMAGARSMMSCRRGFAESFRATGAPLREAGSTVPKRPCATTKDGANPSVPASMSQRSSRPLSAKSFNALTMFVGGRSTGNSPAGSAGLSCAFEASTKRGRPSRASARSASDLARRARSVTMIWKRRGAAAASPGRFPHTATMTTMVRVRLLAIPPMPACLVSKCAEAFHTKAKS
mmetsp:Transcript_43752/g.127327  ORF Transcript_43752/g.127327 Transcript_43752/m.127327 type:complete len:289 (-) Transcript_43752:716-1582(-)